MNKKQRAEAIEALSKQLGKIPDKDKKQAYRSLYTKLWYNESSIRIYCFECGHKWLKRGERPALVVCPKCKNLLHRSTDGRALTEHNYFNRLEVHNGYQVVRLLETRKFMMRGERAKYLSHEVAQHWIDEKGNRTSLTLAVNGMSYNYDQWVYNSDLKVRGCKSYKGEARLAIDGRWIAPSKRILPALRLRGYYGKLMPVSVQDIATALLKLPHRSQAETLLKAKQMELFHSIVNSPARVMHHWPVVKICLRNNYRVDNVKLWVDHIEMLEDMGIDTRNAKYVCPSDLRAEHQRLIAAKQRITKRKEAAKRLAEMNESNVDYIERMQRYFGITIATKEGLIIEPLKTVHDFYNEGLLLNHCVYESEYYTKENSLVLSARLNGEAIETIEVDLQKRKVVQAYGSNNQPTQYHNAIVSAVNKTIKKQLVAA